MISQDAPGRGSATVNSADVPPGDMEEISENEFEVNWHAKPTCAEAGSVAHGEEELLLRLDGEGEGVIAAAIGVGRVGYREVSRDVESL